uniref:Uncharacterized protein n=1 Tax=Caenorhabditis japonica TaxID=281687 RepID=A0A8R1ER06_CAEJA
MRAHLSDRLRLARPSDLLPNWSTQQSRLTPVVSASHYTEPVDQQHHPPPATSPAPSQHPRDPKMQAARVRLPDGVYKEFEVNVSCLDGRKA